MLEHETLVLGVMEGDPLHPRPAEEIAREAARTLWARFGRDLVRSA